MIKDNLKVEGNYVSTWDNEDVDLVINYIISLDDALVPIAKDQICI